MIHRLLSWILLGVVVLLAGCNTDSQQLLDRAEARWREGNYEEAIRLNTLLYQRDPRGEYSARALLNIGNTYYLNLRQLKSAIDAYKKLAGEFPERPEVYHARDQLAVIYENEIGDLTQAIIQYDKMLEAEDLDNRAEIQYRRASDYFKQGDYDRAWRELRRIEESGESGSHLADQVWLKLGNIDQIRRQYEDAAGYFRKVVESPCPECRRRAILNLAETYEALYDYDRAIETIRTLDQSSEDGQRVKREVARLTEEKRRVNITNVPNWSRPHPGVKKKK